MTNVPHKQSPTAYYWLGEFEPQTWFPAFSVVNELADICEESRPVNFIVIAQEGEKQDLALQALRSCPQTALALILVTQPSKLSPHLANGNWEQSFHEKLSHYLEKQRYIQLNPSLDTAYQLLNYLWLHETPLSPLAQPEKPYLYSYPLLQCWGIETNKTSQYLVGLKRKLWLETSEHINRVRLCSDCQSGHLNYIDSCPKCHAIEIDFQASLHCFNCGHVGVQDSFKNLDTLVCPNCLHTLRHIGVDYDRPIENQHCNSCDSLFIEADVKAQCLDCHSEHVIDELVINNIYSYQLSTYGKQLVRSGGSQLIATVFTGELLPYPQFSHIINWQNKLALRHQHTHQLISFEILNFEQVLNKIGDSQTFAQLDALRNELRTATRETDLFCRFAQNIALMFFPHTSDEGLKTIIAKINAIQQMQKSTKIEFSIKQLTLPIKNMPEDNRQWLTEQFIIAKAL